MENPEDIKKYMRNKKKYMKNMRNKKKTFLYPDR